MITQEESRDETPADGHVLLKLAHLTMIHTKLFIPCMAHLVTYCVK